MLLDAFRLDGRTAIVTGAGKGIGYAIAESFAEMGANVVCAARTEADLEAVADRARELGAAALPVVCDVMQEDQLQHLVDRTLEHFGGIDLLINNAGGGGRGYGPVDKVGMSDFEDSLRMNLSSAYTLVHLAVPHLRKSSKAAVVNVSSAMSWMVDRNMAAYGAAKAGMEQMTRILALELAPLIRVNAVAPGAVDTPAAAFLKSDPGLLAETISWIPMRRLGDPIDLALSVLYLASDASNFITGKILEVDGGMQALPGNAIYAELASRKNAGSGKE